MSNENLHSAASLALRLGVGPGQVHRAARLISVTPALTLNGIAYFDGDTAERISDIVRDAKAQARKGSTFRAVPPTHFGGRL